MALQRGLFNITTATTTTLISKDETLDNYNPGGYLTSMNIANIHADNLVYVSLYLDDDTNQTYIFKNHLLWPGERIFLERNEILFDNYNLGFKLTTTATSTSHDINVNVIIR